MNPKSDACCAKGTSGKISLAERIANNRESLEEAESLALRIKNIIEMSPNDEKEADISIGCISDDIAAQNQLIGYITRTLTDIWNILQ
jgi:hypothetical protein